MRQAARSAKGVVALGALRARTKNQEPGGRGSKGVDRGEAVGAHSCAPLRLSFVERVSLEGGPEVHGGEATIGPPGLRAFGQLLAGDGGIAAEGVAQRAP